MRYYFLPTRIAIIKKERNTQKRNKYWYRSGETGTLVYD